MRNCYVHIPYQNLIGRCSDIDCVEIFSSLANGWGLEGHALYEPAIILLKFNCLVCCSIYIYIYIYIFIVSFRHR
jgi:hypothetical protein